MKVKKFMAISVSVFILSLFASLVSAIPAKRFPLIEGKGLGLVLTGNPSTVHRVLIGFKFRPGNYEQALVVRAKGFVKYKYKLVPAIAATIPESAIEGLLKSSRVTHIELDEMVQAVDAELDNTWGVERLGAGIVHDKGIQGQGVKVAIIDSGIDCQHPDLLGNCEAGYDFVNKDNNASDDNGHGTHVAGTVAARKDSAGVVGVAPEARLYALKVLDASGKGYFSDVIAALEWAVINGIQVTNNSYGSTKDPGRTVKQAFDNAYNKGLLHVAAAGNLGNCPGTQNNVIYPARYASVMAVTATDENDTRPCFSSTGDAAELAAPGVDILSTVPGGVYASWTGTSMASPHVAGTAALVISSGLTDSNNNGRINDEVRQILTASADDLGPAGRDAWYGFGLVNALAAVEASAPPAPAVNVTVTTDKAEYYNSSANPDTTAILTAKVTDETGRSISGLNPSAFTTTFNDYSDPVSVMFEETTSPGTYTGDLDIRYLGIGMYTVTVTVLDARSISGSGSATFNVASAPTTPTVAKVTAITYAEMGKDLLITVTLVDNLDNPVVGASVSIDLYRLGRFFASGTGITGTDGKVSFNRRNTPKGCYETKVTAVTATGLTWDGSTPPNQFCK